MKISATTGRLDAALVKVRQLHPFQGQTEFLLMPSVLDEVREKLRACDDEMIRDIAYGFDSSRMMACLEILLRDKDDKVARRAGMVLVLRPWIRVIVSGWFKLALYYPHELLEMVLRSNLREKGFDTLLGLKDVSNRVPTWFVSGRLSDGVLQDYERPGESKRLDSFLESNFIDRKKGLFKEVWRLLLSKGSSTSLQREEPRRILAEYNKAENAQHLPLFCQHYLNILKKRENWDDLILGFIEKKYGVPSDPDGKGVIELPFWRKVQPIPKKEFATWIMLKRIEEFFEGERADFWRRYVTANKVARVKKILGGDGFMIDFGSFGVVEFKNIGNAAYIYPVGTFITYWKRADYERYVSRFKDKEKTVRHRSYHGWDGRIIHKADWQRETSSKIKTLMRND